MDNQQNFASLYDKALRKQILSNPKVYAKSLGYDCEDKTIIVKIDQKNIVHLVVPNDHSINLNRDELMNLSAAQASTASSAGTTGSVFCLSTIGSSAGSLSTVGTAGTAGSFKAGGQIDI